MEMSDSFSGGPQAWPHSGKLAGQLQGRLSCQNGDALRIPTAYAPRPPRLSDVQDSPSPSTTGKARGVRNVGAPVSRTQAASGPDQGMAPGAVLLETPGAGGRGWGQAQKGPGFTLQATGRSEMVTYQG